jgi:hypothetical protein
MKDLNKLTFQSTLLSQSLLSNELSHSLSSLSPSTKSPRAARLDAISARIRAEMIDLDSPIDAIVASRLDVESALKKIKEVVVSSSCVQENVK